MPRIWLVALPLASCLLAACSSSNTDATSANEGDAGEAPDNAVTSVLAPTTVAATAGCTSAWVTWGAVSMPSGTTLTGYSVQQAATTAGPWTDVANCSKTTPTVNNCAALALTGGSTYSFRVAALTTKSSVSSTGPYGTATSAAIHTIGTNCVSGDLGPAGGKIFKPSSGSAFTCGPTRSSSCKYLEYGPNLGSMAWCNKLNKVSTAVDVDFGGGALNTAAMIAIGCTSGAGFAAQAYRGGGFSDWYLPNVAEAFWAYTTVYLSVSSNKFITYSNKIWWTSNQTTDFSPNATTLWISDPSYYTSSQGKTVSFEVHPVRAF